MISEFQILTPYRISNEFWKHEISLDGERISISELIKRLRSIDQEPPTHVAEWSLPEIVSVRTSV